jgi:hypothetical protein
LTQKIITGLDAQWAAVRRDRVLSLVSYGGEATQAVGRVELPGDDVDLAFVGPPTVLAMVAREPEPRLVLHQPPYLDAVARLDLDAPLRIAAITGPRLVLVAPDGKRAQIVRAAGRALAAHPIEPTSPIELAVGLDRNQILVVMTKKLEVWDAVSARPMLRMAMQLPPPPRAIGAAAGHVWATRIGADEVILYRLSDGRPFRHFAGAPIDDVISHPASPFIVLATQRGLVRLHCFAHSVTMIEDAPWTPGAPLAQLVVGDAASLVGLGDGELPWRIPIGGGGAAVEQPPHAADSLVVTIPRARDGAATASELAAARPASGQMPWRDQLAAYAGELVRGAEGEMPMVAVDSELGELAHRLQLPAPARRALVALYALYLVGEPALSIARLARAIGDWNEPLGRGELAAHALVRRRAGTVALHLAATDLLDGAAPRAIRIVGTGAPIVRAGLHQLLRDGRDDTAIEVELAARLGRVAAIDGRVATGVIEAHLRGVTALVHVPPRARPVLPSGGGLVVVVAGETSGWTAELAGLTSARASPP